MVVGTISTSSRNTNCELTVNAARALSPGRSSTELKFRKSITCGLFPTKLWTQYAVMVSKDAFSRNYVLVQLLNS